jgi:hypothetical protein
MVYEQIGGAQNKERKIKNPKIDCWETTGCAQIQEIERPGLSTIIEQ